ncbi:MAG: type I-C CRISPR-associated protein Cas8c/Csd1 [Clostridia bacterium]|jgi:CRISPR-associated protein Csd1|nr:type I-C CRISPR-associated protein Cas8c/Csd1 [Clostridia bacterium]
MLHELANYAAKYDIATLPGFKAKTAKWIIALSEDGKFIDLIEDNRPFPLAPDLDQGELIAGGITRSHFILDTAEVILALGDNKKAIEKHAFFINLLQEAGDVEPLLKIISKTLQNQKALAEIQATFQTKKGNKNDAITFRVGDVYPIELDSWHDWWQEFRQTLKSRNENQAEMICFLSGEKIVPLATHGKIGGLTRVGGQSSGAALIGFDKDAFTSFGLSQSENAACSEVAAATYRNALQHLINKAPAPLAGTMFLTWYKEPIPDEDDLFDIDDLDNPQAEEAHALAKVEKLLTAIKDGQRPDLLNNRYYILQISGAGGRIMVRDWLQGEYKELATNIKQWFEDLTLVSPNGKGLANDFKLSAALTRLVSYRKNDSKIFQRISAELPPLMPRLWRSIVNNLPLPDTVASKSLAYIRSRIHQDEDTSSDNLDRIACALLKAWLIRKMNQGGKQMKPYLNPEHPSPTYHAGRLMAVLASLQNRALGDVGAGVIQRYYAAASTTPALVLGRLVRGAQYHLDKLDKRAAIRYEQLLGSIMVQLGDKLPSSLTLEEQSLFALGYYQQRAELFAGSKKSDNANIDTDNKN